VRAKRLKPEALGVGGELPPPRFVAAAAVLRGRAGDEFAGGGDGARDVRGGRGRNVDHAQRSSAGGRARTVVLIKPLTGRYRLSAGGMHDAAFLIPIGLLAVEAYGPSTIPKGLCISVAGPLRVRTGAAFPLALFAYTTTASDGHPACVPCTT